MSTTFEVDTATGNDCLEYMSNKLAPLIAIIRQHKAQGQTRCQTDYWFPILKPLTNFSQIERHGKMKSKQIPFSEALDLNCEETHKLLFKVS